MTLYRLIVGGVLALINVAMVLYIMLMAYLDEYILLFFGGMTLGLIIAISWDFIQEIRFENRRQG